MSATLEEIALATARYVTHEFGSVAVLSWCGHEDELAAHYLALDEFAPLAGYALKQVTPMYAWHEGMQAYGAQHGGIAAVVGHMLGEALIGNVSVDSQIMSW